MGLGLGIFNPTAFLGTAASMGGAILGYQGQRETNETNQNIAASNMQFSAEQAAKQMEFQERMSSTGYQRATKDMIAAGLNPMLAYQQGGASSPQGAMASPVTPVIGNKMAAGLSSGFQSAQVMAGVQNVKADTLLKEAEADRVREDTILKGTTGVNIAADTVKKRAEVSRMNYEVDKLIAEKESIQNQEKQRAFDVNILMPLEAKLRKAQAELAELEIPRMKNLADSQGSWWMRNVSPYLGDVGRVTGSSADLGVRRRGPGLTIKR